MPLENIKQVAVVGAGSMGHQIAMLSALGGFETYLQDISDESLANAKEQLEKRMTRWVSQGKLTEAEKLAAFSRLQMTTDLTEAVGHADLVIEAVVEKLEVKREVFKQLDELAPPHTILATNSSTIVSSKLADVVDNPARVCNIHFFNPALVMEMVEVVKGPHTSDETAEKAMAFVQSIGKTPVLLKKEISGFIANRILGKVFDEAVFLYENGYATHEEIDLICKKALNHPIGPFELMDLVGIDVSYNARLQRYRESGDERDKPAKLLEEKVKKGELGRKTGKGFYTYE